MKLEIIDLYAAIEGKQILNGVNLEINSGEVHAIMGPNGTGKSTLSAVIMGDPRFDVISGKVLLDGEDVLKLPVDNRAKLGLFLAMQYPSEIAGISNSDFIRSASIALNGEEKQESLFKFAKRLNGSIDDLKMSSDFSSRYLNVGFSGGEKKRNEILQMKMLKPKFGILDEIDSGLDIDAMTIVGENLTEMMNERKDELGLLLITHYQRLLDYIKPTHVHVMLNGKIVETGDSELAKKLENEGYEILKKKYGIVDSETTKINDSIGMCATNLGVNSAK